jgi:hypothetical protein
VFAVSKKIKNSVKKEKKREEKMKLKGAVLWIV